MSKREGSFKFGLLMSIGAFLVCNGFAVFSLCVGYIKLGARHGTGGRLLKYEDEPLKFVAIIGVLFLFGILAGILSLYLIRNKEDLQRYEKRS